MRLGGAPAPVLDMLDGVMWAARARLWLESEMAAGRRVMGHWGTGSTACVIREPKPWRARCSRSNAPALRRIASRWRTPSSTKRSAFDQPVYVTRSVAIGSQRDEQDASGRDLRIVGYLRDVRTLRGTSRISEDRLRLFLDVGAKDHRLHSQARTSDAAVGKR